MVSEARLSTVSPVSAERVRLDFRRLENGGRLHANGLARLDPRPIHDHVQAPDLDAAGRSQLAMSIMQYNQMFLSFTDGKANTLLVADSRHWDAVHWRIAYANVCGASCTPEARIVPNCRHINGSNIIYSDGHLRFLTASEMSGIFNAGALSLQFHEGK